MAFNHRRERK